MNSEGSRHSEWPELDIAVAALRRKFYYLPNGASAEELAEFERYHHLPAELKALYIDHNGELSSPLRYRLLPLGQVFSYSESSCTFWECVMDSSRPGVDYCYTTDTILCEGRAYPSVSALLEALIELPAIPDEHDPLLARVADAEKLDCAARKDYLISLLPEIPETHSELVERYLLDEDEDIIEKACAWFENVTRPISGVFMNHVYSSNSSLRNTVWQVLSKRGISLRAIPAGTPLPDELSEIFVGRLEDERYFVRWAPAEDWEFLTALGRSQPPGPIIESARLRPGMYFGPLYGGANKLALDMLFAALEMRPVDQVHLEIDEWNLSVESNSNPPKLADPHQYPPYFHTPEPPFVHYGCALADVIAVSEHFSILAVDEQRYFQRGKTMGDSAYLCEQLPAGWRIRLTLDRTIWPEGFDRVEISGRIRELVHLIPTLSIALNGQIFSAPNGLSDLLDTISTPKLTVSENTEFLSLELVVCGRTEQMPTIESWVNFERSSEHGSHVDGALQALSEFGWRPQTLLIHVTCREQLIYFGSTRDRLSMPKILRQVRELVRKRLKSWTETADTPRA